MKKGAWSASMEDVLKHCTWAGKPAWETATVVYMQAYMFLTMSEAWWRGGERDGFGTCGDGMCGKKLFESSVESVRENVLEVFLLL